MSVQPDSTAVPALQAGGGRLVWWRDEAASTEVPRRHVIGWSVTDASRHGSLAIDSEHLRLTRKQIETRLIIELDDVRRAHGGRDGDDGEGRGVAGGADCGLQPAYECWAELSPAVRIIAGGHRLVAFDLRPHYGPGCLAGVSAELRGHGIAARVVLDPHLTAAEKTDSLLWAEQQLSIFRALDPSHLRERMWSQTTPSRWQILSYRD